MSRFSKGQHAYFVRSNSQVIEVQVLNSVNGFCTIKFLDTGGGIRVRDSKLYLTEEDANKHVTNVVGGRRQHKPYW